MRDFGPAVAAGAAVLLSSFFFAAGASAQARIVAVRSADLTPYDQAIDGFRASLPQADIQVVTLPGNPAGDQALAEGLNRQKPDLVLAVGVGAAKLCRLHVKSAPVLFCMVMEAEELGYGGVSLALSLEETLEWSFRSFPQFKKVGLIYNPARWPALTREVRALEKKGVLSAVTAASPADLERSVAALKGGVDALLLLPDPVLFPVQTMGAFMAQLIKENIPIIGVSQSYVKAGAIAAFFADYRNNGELAGSAAARLLRGDDVKNVPVMTPTKVAVSINLLIARHMNRMPEEEAVKVAAHVVR
jgi:putative tryptophan/tyrosine transport system substrate-binding protein